MSHQVLANSRKSSILLSGTVAALAAVGLLLSFGHLPNAFRWPARGLILLCFLWATWRLPGESVRLAQWLGRGISKLNQWSQIAVTGRWVRGAEVLKMLASAVVIALCLVYFGRTIGEMAVCSLRIDEITSVWRYTSQGPLEVVTNYHRANNHIFLNLLHSLFPGADSYDPLRMRFFSMAAMSGLVVCGVGYFWQRKAYAAAAVMAVAICLNPYHLHLELQSRAYGIVSFFSFLCTVAFVAHRARPTTGPLIWLGVLTVLGAYTVPYFVVFGGGLVALLFFLRPSVPILLTGAWTLLILGLLYLPLGDQFLDVAESYDEDYGQVFTDLRALNGVLLYLIPHDVMPSLSFAHVGAGLLVLFLAALAPAIQQSRRSAAGLLVVGVALGFLVFCYVLESPPRRVAAFTVIPLMAGLLIAAVHVRLKGSSRLAATVLGLIVAIALVPYAAWRNALFDFLPTQKWLEVARAVRLLYPEGTQVWVEGNLRENRAYLGNKYPLLEGGDPPFDSVQQGRAVIHDAKLTKKSIEHLFKPEDRPAGIEKISFAVGLGDKCVYVRPQWGPFSQGPVAGAKPEAYEFEMEQMAGSTGLWIRQSQPWSRRPHIWTWGDDNQKARLRNAAFAIEGEHLFVRLPPGTRRIRLERVETAGGPLRFYGTGPIGPSAEAR